MLTTEHPRTSPTRIRIRRTRVALILTVVAVAVALGHLPSAGPREAPRPSLAHGPLGEADGAVPDGTTVFDDGVPGVAKLDPALLAALRRAAGDAAAEGIRLGVDSGWRSTAYQEHLLQDAIARYGSRAAAARWVAAPNASAHVQGRAVDIGPAGAAEWLSRNGPRYGLCRIYGNEPWHYELRPDAATGGCPALYADPTQDPRSNR